MSSGEQYIRKEMTYMKEEAYENCLQLLASSFKVKIAKSHLEKYCVWGIFRE